MNKRLKIAPRRHTEAVLFREVYGALALPACCVLLQPC